MEMFRPRGCNLVEIVLNGLDRRRRYRRQPECGPELRDELRQWHKQFEQSCSV